MKEEIKEILKLYKNDDIEYYNQVSDLGYDKLLDYITNLQEEIKFKEDYKDAYETTMIAYKMIEEKYNDYKQRNKKAIKYIIDNCILSDEWKDLGFCNFIPTGRIGYKQLSKTKIKYLLNILKGE